MMIHRIRTFIFTFAMMTLAGAAAAQETTLPSRLVFPDIIGVNYGGGFGPADMDEIAQKLGPVWVRVEMPWSGVEPRKGEYRLDNGLQLLRELHARKLKVLLILNYGNPAYQSLPGEDPFVGPTTPEAVEGFARYAETLANAITKELPDLPIIYEIWNEPDYKLFWRPEPNAEHYVNLVKATAPRVRRAAPGRAIVGPATMSSKTKFIDRCIELGILEHIDALSVHPYRRTKDGGGYPETVIPDYARVRGLMKAWFDANGRPGKMVPLISSEWGYSETSLPDGAGVTEEQQAQYFVRMMLVHAMEGLPVSIWFQWQSGDDPNNVWSHFGLKRKDGTPRPSLKAAEVMCRMLNGCEFAERIDLGAADRYGLRFRAEDRTVEVYWTTSEPFPLAPGKEGDTRFTATTLFGDPIDAMPALEVGRSPVYVTFAE
jgi:hypothetical protein